MEKQIIDEVFSLEKRYTAGPKSKNYFTNASPLTSFLFQKKLVDTLVSFSSGESVSLDDKQRYQEQMKYWNQQILPLWKKFHKKVMLWRIPFHLVQVAFSILFCW